MSFDMIFLWILARAQAGPPKQGPGPSRALPQAAPGPSRAWAQAQAGPRAQQGPGAYEFIKSFDGFMNS